jgi:hypothetical protein
MDEGTTVFCYRLQAWIVNGLVDPKGCGHPDSMECACYSKNHAGEQHPQDCPDCH